MGLLDENQDFVKNPAKITLEWSGDGVEGGFIKSYNPDAKENVNHGNYKPLVPIMSTSSVGGYKALGQGSGISYFSNEVVRIGSDNLTVFEKKTGGKAKVLISGIYSDIKETLQANGAHYVKNIYCYDGEQIVRLKLKGGSLFAFGEAEEQIPNGKKNTGKAIAITGYEQKKNGGVHFRSPTFGVVDVEEQMITDAFAIAKEEVSPYIDHLRAKALEEPKNTAPSAETNDMPSESDDIEEDCPF